MAESGKSEFWKWAEQNGKIKNVSDAFEEYPVEEEWHKGNAANYVSEPKEVYDEYNIGDIVFVKNFKFPNGKEGRDHLFVIIDKNNFAIPAEYLAMLISSKIQKAKYDANILLTRDKQNGLEKDSIVKTDAIYQIDNSEVLFRIGTVTQSAINFYLNNYREKPTE